ncbi:cupin domain-containing protein [Halomarina rubra]|uniref:Cupin domain-containing protein n=1 Tax=Halomarina rubra TaxID=2071873 RepID=A0ABD6B064_9EURY|nr:cupin domain-containing protein [Halomarina rubra]
MAQTTAPPTPWHLDAREGDAYWSLGSLTVMKATAENTDGAFSVIEELVPAGASPPRHVHREDDELFYVLDGVVTFEVDDEQFTARAGSTVFAPHGRPHSYRVEEETRWLMVVQRPGLERLWAEVGRPADAWTTPDDDLLDEQMGAMMQRLDEFGIDIVGEPMTAGGDAPIG